jgi:flagellar protein FliO/FliZ
MMESYFFWTSLLVVLAVLSVGASIFVRSYLAGVSPAALLFRPKGDRRLEVIDHASIDGRRKLILIRRDDVEHLLLTGGPVDVVVETGIKSAAARPVIMPASADVPPQIRRTPAFGRQNEPAPLTGVPER